MHSQPPRSRDHGAAEAASGDVCSRDHGAAEAARGDVCSRDHGAAEAASAGTCHDATAARSRSHDTAVRTRHSSVRVTNEATSCLA
jgi:hypothetical protein